MNNTESSESLSAESTLQLQTEKFKEVAEQLRQLALKLEEVEDAKQAFESAAEQVDNLETLAVANQDIHSDLIQKTDKLVELETQLREEFETARDELISKTASTAENAVKEATKSERERLVKIEVEGKKKIRKCINLTIFGLVCAMALTGISWWTYNSEVNRIQKVHSGVVEDLKKSESQVSDLQSQLNTANSQNETLSSQVKQANAKNDIISTDLEKAQAENQKLEQKLKSLEEKDNGVFEFPIFEFEQ